MFSEKKQFVQIKTTWWLPSAWLALWLLLLSPASLPAQRVQLRDFFGGAAPANQLPTPPSVLPSIPQGGLGFAQPAIQNPPIFDGFSPGGIQPQLPQILPPQGLAPPIQANPLLAPSPNFPIFPRNNPFPNPAALPQGSPPALGRFPIQPQSVQPFLQPNQPFGQPVANRWPYAGTGSNWLPAFDFTGPQQAWAQFRDNFLPRVLERPRARQTWIVGNSDNELEQNDLEIATTLTLPNFIGSTQPLRISPGFIFHWLNGPNTDLNPGFDLPPQLFSTYVSFDHTTNPNNQFGFENNFTVGFYSDFQNFSSDGIRLTGRLVGWGRVNEYTVAKLGVEYFDRVDIKILPAFGVYLAPNPNIRWDLFFPRTKLAHRLPNLGNFEVWSYLGAEYGGGSWALDRIDGSPDQTDINDVRSFVGFEWIGPRRVTGFFEVGYVFNREIINRSNQDAILELEDAFLLRSGVAF